MSIVKSTKSGKSAVPLTLEYVLNHGYKLVEEKIPVSGIVIRKVFKGKHFLTLDSNDRIFWKYETKVNTRKFYLDTIADFDLIETYYSEYKPNKRNRACNAILNDPRTQSVNPKMWFSELPEGMEFDKHGKMVRRKKKTLDDCIVITPVK